MSKSVARAACDLQIATWNKCYPVGTPVRFWPMALDGESKVSKTRSEATIINERSTVPVVWIEGHAGCVALSHVEPIKEVEA
ncbi:MAG: hypothetical protein JNK63_09835 [Chthonomonas sp.]|nr:hypothetical protein [Chthonomonas sp.]